MFGRNRRAPLVVVLLLAAIAAVLILIPSESQAAIPPVSHQINYVVNGQVCGWERYFCDGSYAFSGSLMGTEVHYWYSCGGDNDD